MQYLGDYAEDYATLNFKFSTHKSDGTPIALSGTPSISCYKGSSTLQTTVGVSLAVDFDGVTGSNAVTADLSADAFYAVANDYAFIISAGTVNSVSVVGTVLAHFSIQNRYAYAGTHSGVTNPVTVSSGTITTVTGAVGSVTGNVGGTVSTVTTLTNLPAAPTDWLTAAAVKADAVTKIQLGLATPTNITAGTISTVTGGVTVSSGTITSVTNGVTLSAGQHVIVDSGTVTTISTTVTVDSATIANAVWDEPIGDHSSTGSTGLALATASSGGVDPSILAAAVWDESLSGHSTAGTSGKKLTDLVNADLSGVATSTDLATVAGYIDTEVAAILTDTNELQTDWTNGGRLDLLIDAIKAKTDVGLSTATWTSTMASYLDAAISSRSTISAADVNAEVVDVMRTDTATELTGVPAASPSLHTMVQFNYMKIRNQETITGSTSTLAKSDNTVIATAAIGDTGTTFTKGKYA